MPSVDPTAALASRDLSLARSDEHARWFFDEVQPHERGLKSWLRRRFPWVTDVDDLVQETFAKVLHARREGRVAHARSYLFCAARNAVYDAARRNHVVTFESVESFADLEVIDERPDAAETLAREHDLSLLAAAIEALPERCRLVVKLRKLHGLSYDEIARELGIAERTVNAQLAKGMALCRRYLQRHGVKRDE